MITAEQLKDVVARVDALHHYLNIDKKKIEFEEEQLRTQAPDFWEDADRAMEQMKKVKGIEKWLKGYNNVRSQAEELQLAFDFYKDELVTEEEVDNAYKKVIT
ncbi:peptide chain release factor 2, partial [Escherichia coli]|nr:peptide chain release factor 2 [Escherichia coli]